MTASEIHKFQHVGVDQQYPGVYVACEMVRFEFASVLFEFAAI